MLRIVTVARVTAENRCSARDPAVLFWRLSVRCNKAADRERASTDMEYQKPVYSQTGSTAPHLPALRFCSIRARCEQSDERRASQDRTVGNAENAGACEKIGEHDFVGLCGMGDRLLLL
jgi:hypothetical protein